MLDGNSEIRKHERNNLRYLICVGHWITSHFSPKRSIFLHACSTGSEFPSNISPSPVLTVIAGSVKWFPWNPLYFPGNKTYTKPFSIVLCEVEIQGQDQGPGSGSRAGLRIRVFGGAGSGAKSTQNYYVLSSLPTEKKLRTELKEEIELRNKFKKICKWNWNRSAELYQVSKAASVSGRANKKKKLFSCGFP